MKKPFPWSQSRLFAQQTVQHRDHLGAGAGGLRHQPVIRTSEDSGVRRPCDGFLRISGHLLKIVESPRVRAALYGFHTQRPGKAVEHDRHLLAGDGIAGAETAVTVAGDDAKGRRPADSLSIVGVGSHIGKERRLLRLVTYQIQEKERSNRIMIGILSQIVEFRNSESGPHVIHLNIISRLLLEQLIKKKNKYHLSWQEIGLIATASALHDIGKINIDEKILNKPGKLTKEEFEIMKTHTTIGAAMIGKINLYHSERLVQLAYEICRWHHERWDGKGYPDGLKGDEIPISAQVVSVADVYDALVSERIYKKAYPHEVAIQMILNGECGNFNPLILECMLDIQDEIRRKISVTSTEDFVRDADAQENMDIANMQLNPLMME